MPKDNSTPCIVCGSDSVEQFLDLGVTPLANKFLKEEQLSLPEPMFPLRVGLCAECKHVQLLDGVPPSAMFEDYLYISSASDVLKAHLLDLSDIVTQRCGLGAQDLVIDVGCNDGTLLSGFQRHGVRVLGVDPAKNLVDFTAAKGIDRYVGFFNSQSAKEIVAEYGHAKVITATNTFPHIPALRDFVQGLQTALAPGGFFVVEAHSLFDMLEQVAFDTIYHEHISYWALAPMIRLFEEHGMEVVNAERLPLHHGQLRVFVQRRGEGKVQPAVAQILELEKKHGLDRMETYKAFANSVERIKQDLTRAIRDLRAQGKRVVGYGAPAKGNTLLCYLQLGPDKIDYIADKSRLKQGLFTPGMHVPVVPPERILEDQPDYLLVLAWNFLDEIIEQQADYRSRGGQFILPVPKVKII
jgi:SAM-dependent methyltransferase